MVARLREVIYASLYSFGRHGGAVVDDLSAAREKVRTAWRAECAEWAKYITGVKEAHQFVDATKLEESLTGRDPAPSSDEDIKAMLQLLPKDSIQRSIVAEMLICDRAERELGMSHGLVNDRSVQTLLSGNGSASIRYQTTVENGSGSDGETDAAMSDQAATPSGLFRPGGQGPETDCKATALPYTFSEADERAYATGMKWQDAYENDLLFPVAGERERQRIAKAERIDAKLSVYDEQIAALARNPIDPDLCASIATRIKDLASREAICAKLEQKAWARYIEDATTGRLARVNQYIDYFILEHQLCNLPPSKESDELVECARKGLMKGTLADMLVGKLLSSRRDENWQSIDSPAY